VRALPLVVLAAALGLTACEREKREFRPNPAESDTTEVISQSQLSPGATPPVEIHSGKGETFEGNAYHLSEGKRLYGWYNCKGCHFNGGGGIGPPLMDDKWIYGSNIENIVATIEEGRPNGMPSFRGKIPDEQVWQIAAYVRSMSGNVPFDAAPSRNDDIQSRPAENTMPEQTPIEGGNAPP
jgi:cytochrome c oxidase cbb3-type subunit 3